MCGNVWIMIKRLGSNNLPLSNVHENKTKYMHKMGGGEGQKSCLYTGSKGPSSLFRVEGCF